MRWRWRVWGTSIFFPPASSCATPPCGFLGDRGGGAGGAGLGAPGGRAGPPRGAAGLGPAGRRAGAGGRRGGTHHRAACRAAAGRAHRVHRRAAVSGHAAPVPEQGMNSAGASPGTTTADLLVCHQLGGGGLGRRPRGSARPLLTPVHTLLVSGGATANRGPWGAGKSPLFANLWGQRAPRSGHV